MHVVEQARWGTLVLIGCPLHWFSLLYVHACRKHYKFHGKHQSFLFRLLWQDNTSNDPLRSNKGVLRGEKGDYFGQVKSLSWRGEVLRRELGRFWGQYRTELPRGFYQDHHHEVGRQAWESCASNSLSFAMVVIQCASHHYEQMDISGWAFIQTSFSTDYTTYRWCRTNLVDVPFVAFLRSWRWCPLENVLFEAALA